jgi:predicted SAM-dependent methyltransferase
MRCNICGNDKFVDMNKRQAVRCSKCGSLERTRIIALFIEKYHKVSKSTRILHIAPEKGLAEYFYNIAGDNCVFVDIDPKRYSHIPNIKKLDLCHDLDGMATESFDLIIHSHVMEHIPCNYTYVLYHFDRILSQKGRMICSIPFLSGFYDCCTSPNLSDEERTKRFGQFDHVRRYGTSDLQLSLGKVCKLENEYDVTKHFSEDELIKFNIPEVVWRGYTPSSVLNLGKGDYLLK